MPACCIIAVNSRFLCCQIPPELPSTWDLLQTHIQVRLPILCRDGGEFRQSGSGPHAHKAVEAVDPAFDVRASDQQFFVDELPRIAVGEAVSRTWRFRLSVSCRPFQQSEIRTELNASPISFIPSSFLSLLAFFLFLGSCRCVGPGRRRVRRHGGRLLQNREHRPGGPAIR